MKDSGKREEDEEEKLKNALQKQLKPLSTDSRFSLSLKHT
jgi:hypothetical protein